MPDPVHPVLVGIDGSAAGLEGLELGRALAVLSGAPLLLGGVYGYEGDYWPPLEHVQGWLEAAAELAGDAVACRTAAVLSTSPARGLTHLAARERASIIVLGSSHHGPFGRGLLGSTARGVAHGSPCTIAVVPHGWKLRPADAPLVFGTGFTDAPEARDALALAAQLAAPAHAALRVVSAVHIPPPEHPMFAATGTSYEGWRRDQRRAAHRAAVEASAELDLLVVGSRRYGPLRRVLLGAVSTPLIERAACPVLIVPRAVHADDEHDREPEAVTYA